MRALALVALLAAPAAADPRAQQVHDLLEAQRQKLHIAGLAYAVVVDDQVVAIEGLGERDLATKLPVTPDTVFPIGSCTKAFTAAAIGIAQDEGVLALDDSPRRYLPWFKMQDAEANELVTLRDMLSHRTGLRAYADLAALGGAPREDYLRAAIGAKPVAKLRATYQYSNAMVAAAGEAVARAYKLPWDGVITAKLFKPLGMTASLTSAFDVAKAKDGTIGYVYDGTWKATPVERSLAPMAPAGAIASSARDMTRWIRMLAGGGKLDGKQIIASATLAELVRPHTRINAQLAYALGWATYDAGAVHVVEHNGGSAGVSALVSFIPDRHAGFVVLANSSPTALTSIGVLGGQLWPIILGIKPSATQPTAPPHGVPPVMPPSGTSDIPPVDELLARMLAAAGGPRPQQRHVQMRLRAHAVYENQGVRGELAIAAKAPGRRVEDETLFSGAHRLGRARTWFDGTRGAQQTTFGQDSMLAGDDLDAARRDNLLHPLLDLRAAYTRVTVERVAKLDGEDAFVLLLAPATGKPVRLYVSARTSLVVRRETADQATTFRDFRNVDGEVVPFASTTEGPLGEVTTRVDEVRFDAAVADTEFAAAAALR